MSGIRGKLQRAFGVAKAPPPAATSPVADVLRRHQARHRRRLPEIALPDGADLDAAPNSCYLRRVEYDLDHLHGDLTLAVAQRADWDRLGELAKVTDLSARLQQCLFLDTETTGLAGGAGTVVFMCGMGFFEPDRFVFEQVFLRAFAEERAALLHVARRLQQRPWLVTFVGKSYDRHRIAARMAVHKVESEVLTDQHLDLYHMARRAWGKALPNVKLRTVEEQRLGFFRQDDMPGAEAPHAFLTWIRDRTGRVDHVFEHNRLDVLSLVTLLGALGRG